MILVILFLIVLIVRLGFDAQRFVCVNFAFTKNSILLRLYDLSVLNNLIYRFCYMIRCEPHMGTKVLCTCWL